MGNVKCNVTQCGYRNMLGYCLFTACINNELYNHFNIRTFSDSTSNTYNEPMYTTKTIITNKGKY